MKAPARPEVGTRLTLTVVTASALVGSTLIALFVLLLSRATSEDVTARLDTGLRSLASEIVQTFPALRESGMPPDGWQTDLRAGSAIPALSPAVADVASRASGMETAVFLPAPGSGDLLAAVGQLPPAQRAALILRHYHDLSYREIAEVLETTRPAVESLLFRARQSLQKALDA